MGMRSFCCVITTLTCTSILIRRNISAFALDKKRYYPTPNVIPALISRSGRLRGQKFPFLSFSAESGLGRILSNTSPVNHARRGMDIAFTADLAATLLAMVKAGDGIARCRKVWRLRMFRPGRLPRRPHRRADYGYPLISDCFGLRAECPER